MATRLPRRLEENMKIVGEQIKLARLRRNLSRAQVAERAMCSELTEARVEKGSPTVAIGIYLRVYRRHRRLLASHGQGQEEGLRVIG